MVEHDDRKQVTSYLLKRIDRTLWAKVKAQSCLSGLTVREWILQAIEHTLTATEVKGE